MRGISYKRDVRNKAIARKKRIVNAVYNGYWYEHDGQFSKGKIHCSCPLCAFGKYSKTESDMRKEDSMDYKLYEYLHNF